MGFGNDRLRVGCLKYFADGGMGARTAWMLEPYLDADRGMPITSMEQLARDIRKAHRHGLAVMVHAIGDRTCRELVGVFETLEQRADAAREAMAPPLPPHRNFTEFLYRFLDPGVRSLRFLGAKTPTSPTF